MNYPTKATNSTWTQILTAMRETGESGDIFIKHKDYTVCIGAISGDLKLMLWGEMERTAAYTCLDTLGALVNWPLSIWYSSSSENKTRIQD